MIFDLDSLNKTFEAEKWLQEHYGCEFYTSNKGWINSSCPFNDHIDSNPSFGINQEKGIFKCFGCGKEGSFITLVSKINNLSFYKAIKLIAEYSNIKIDKYDSFEYNNRKFQKSLIEEDNTLYNNNKIIQQAIIKIKKKLEIDFNKADNMYKELDILIKEESFKSIKEKEWKI